MIRTAAQVCVLCGLLAFAVTGTAAQGQSSTSGAEQTSSASLFDRLVSGIYGDNPLETVKQIDELLDRNGNDQSSRALLLAMRGAAHLNGGKVAKAVSDFEMSRRADPSASASDYFRFVSGLTSKNFVQASTGLDGLLARSPNDVRNLSFESVVYYLRNEQVPKDHIEDQRILLAQLGYGGMRGDHLALKAIGILLKRGRTAEAIDLVQYVDRVELIQTALVDRRYTAIWPVLERAAGDNLSTAAELAIQRARAWLSEKPGDMERRTELISALSTARQFDEAIAVGNEIGSSDAALAALDEDGGWAVNAHALALHRAGRALEADRRYESLNRAAKDKSWAVSMIINRLELLVKDGRYTEAERLLPYTASFTGANGSPYANQLVRRLKICTLAGLKKVAELPPLAAEVKRHTDDSPAVTAEALLCLGDADGAEEIVLKQLADPEKAQDFVVNLQKKPIASEDPSLWTRNWVTLRGRPAIEAAFNKEGRDLPDRFYKD